MKKVLLFIGLVLFFLNGKAQLSDSLRHQYDELKSQMFGDRSKYERVIIPSEKNEDKTGIITAYINSKGIPMFIILDNKNGEKMVHSEYYYYDGILYYMEEINVESKSTGHMDRYYFRTGKMLAWYDSFHQSKNPASDEFSKKAGQITEYAEKLRSRMKK